MFIRRQIPFDGVDQLYCLILITFVSVDINCDNQDVKLH